MICNFLQVSFISCELALLWNCMLPVFSIFDRTNCSHTSMTKYLSTYASEEKRLANRLQKNYTRKLCYLIIYRIVQTVNLPATIEDYTRNFELWITLYLYTMRMCKTKSNWPHTILDTINTTWFTWIHMYVPHASTFWNEHNIQIHAATHAQPYAEHGAGKYWQAVHYSEQH